MAAITAVQEEALKGKSILERARERAVQAAAKYRSVPVRAANWVRTNALTIGGFGLIDVGVFTINEAAGFIVSGISCLVLDWKVDERS